MHASVMLLLYPKDGQYHLLLNKRTDLVEHHKGEISFPGGAQDPEDNSYRDTALRETDEEMGVRPEDVQVLGELDDIPTRSGFLIHPFVGVIPYPYKFTVSTIEVAEVLEVPLPWLLNNENVREEARLVDGQLTKSHTYRYNNHLVFGATARIIEQLLGLLADEPDMEALWKTTENTATLR